ncbi:sensor histidine kinase [Streptomyces sp. bgisy100]|uniref:sensor histidine kinase n=1 Tax=Streptomyces sp. bgisy100 TaxID=3413783 RepID=UPI003D71BDCA
MPASLRRIHRLRLRSRLALLTAVAVAVAVAVSAFACWFLTRNQLRAELDNSLHNTSIPPGFVGQLLRNCRDTEPNTNKEVLPGIASGQLVLADGHRCVGINSQPVEVERVDQEVAAGVREEALHDGVTDSGEPVRVLTQQTQVGSAVSVSRPLSEIDGALNTLALLLVAVAGVGVVGAATAGLWIARAGLKPVDRLTGAVEHVARTEDLAVRIPVEGEDEIARLSQSFNAMTAALASSRDRQQQLIADAGHELRTPLTSLRTNIELLVRSAETGRALPEADRRELLSSVKAQVVELGALIGDLQELSRPDAVAGSGPLEVVALHEITGRAVERARLRGSGLAVTTELDPWYVRGEPAALERAVVNLLDNAVKFSGGGTEGGAGGPAEPSAGVSGAGGAGRAGGAAPAAGTGQAGVPAEGAGAIEVRLRGGALTVRDHGPGIPADELPHVFERFWRSTSARSLPGSGLGLSIVARTVQQAGGTVTLEAAPGGGTLARLALPGSSAPPPETVP